MSLYLTQIAYTQEAWRLLINNPRNRFETVRPAIEKLGGKVIDGWPSVGEYEVILVAEMPDHVTAAALAMAFAAGGACKAVRTIPLFSTTETTDALKEANASG